MAAVRTLLAAAILLALSAGMAVAQPAPSQADQSAKAVSNIGPFAEWPASAFDGPNAPLVICIIGPDPFGDALDKRVAAQKINGRAVVVRRFDKAEKSLVCHIAFLSAGPVQTIADALAAFRGQPVLTVTDERRGGGAQRGIMHFVNLDGRMQFYIDEQAAMQSRLTLSAKLLSLAIAVKPRG